MKTTNVALFLKSRLASRMARCPHQAARQGTAATRARDALNAERRRLPMVRIEKDYVFEGPNGKASLLDLFEGRHQLIIYHFMYHEDQDKFCDGWSFFVEQICVEQIRHLAHLHARDTSWALVARAAGEDQVV